MVDELYGKFGKLEIYKIKEGYYSRRPASITTYEKLEDVMKC